MSKALDDIYNDGVKKGTEENESINDALIVALANAGRVQEIVRCTSDKEYKKKLLSEFNLNW